MATSLRIEKKLNVMRRVGSEAELVTRQASIHEERLTGVLEVDTTPYHCTWGLEAGSMCRTCYAVGIALMAGTWHHTFLVLEVLAVGHGETGSHDQMRIRADLPYASWTFADAEDTLEAVLYLCR